MRTLVVAVAAALASGTAALPSSAAAPTSSAASGDAPGGLRFGVATPGLPGDRTGLNAFGSAVGVPPDVALSFTSFRYPMNADGLRAEVAAGLLPMVTWEPFDATTPTVDAYPLRVVAGGGLDPYLRAQAAAVRAAGGPVAIRFGHEMNASWYPWGAGVRGNTPADYVAAYRHVHDVFEAEGAVDVVWVWSPSALDTAVQPDLAPFYPGDDVVDWVALSAYFDQDTDTWARTVAPSVRRLDQVAPGRPFFLAETGVLPGPRRPAMLRDLVQGLVATPGALGMTYLEIPSRFDWRLTGDAASLGALREELSSGWFAAAGPDAPPPPVVQVLPVVTGTARVGGALAATTGSWRTGAGPPTSYAGRWLRCTGTGTGTETCTPTGSGTSPLVLGDGDLGAALRWEVTATSAAGATVARSLPTGPVLRTPARPARPRVEAHPTALRVVFPPAPVGTTVWQLSVDGVTQRPPTSAGDVWVPGLTNGRPVRVELAALAVSQVETLTSPVTAGTATPTAAPYSPYVVVSGTTGTLTLPRVPAGATTWVLTVDGLPRTLPTSTTTVTLPDLATGRPHPWSLTAASGAWDGGGPGALTPAVAGSMTPVAAPAAPVVVGGGGAVTVTLPAAPPGATGWRVSVGATSRDLPAGAVSTTVSGLAPGWPATWTLRATGPGSMSSPVTGRVTP